jgi:DUF4097 and DUF4098 domain-containing protein YvlB
MAFLLVFQLALSAAAPQDSDNISKTFSPKEKVEMKLVSGDCFIEIGNADRILVDVQVDVSDPDAFNFRFYERGNRLIIEEDWSGWSSGSVIWTVIVPQGTEFEIETASGDVSLNGLKSEAEINTASGDVRIKNFEGELDINTASGDVTAENSQGEIDISVASGDVSLDGLKGDIDVSAASGDITIESSEARFDVSCASGDIEAERIKIMDHSEFSDASGDIEIGLAESAKYDLSLSTASGDIQLDYNGNPFSGYFEATARKDKGEIRLPVKAEKEETITRNGRGYFRKTFSVSTDTPQIIMETASGTITLEK